jgi:DtxR family Mn-dependent transcriptional regulator
VITQEREDYLKTIYMLQQDENPVRTNSIARGLGIEPASVTGVLKRLSELMLVEYEPYRGATLTSAGEKIALEVIRRHRLIELFLIQSLGYTWDEVHEEAERLEHVVSDKFEERIVAVLGNPAIDPHGSPIPTKDGHIAPLASSTLANLQAGQEGHVARVSDDDPELLRYLAGMGIIPGKYLEIIEVTPFGGPIHVKVDSSIRLLGPDAASKVFIEVA